MTDIESPPQIARLSTDDYLALESSRGPRHEFIGGAVYKRGDSSANHNRIVGNVYSAFHRHLHGGPYEPFAVNFKLRMMVCGVDIFYYPDVMVARSGEGIEEYYLRNPKLIVEVMSRDSENADSREKWVLYQCIESLEEYVLVAEDACAVAIHRRDGNWEPTVVSSPGDTVEFRSIRLTMTIGQIYGMVG